MDYSMRLDTSIYIYIFFKAHGLPWLDSLQIGSSGSHICKMSPSSPIVSMSKYSLRVQHNGRFSPRLLHSRRAGRVGWTWWVFIWCLCEMVLICFSLPLSLSLSRLIHLWRLMTFVLQKLQKGFNNSKWGNSVINIQNEWALYNH